MTEMSFFHQIDSKILLSLEQFQTQNLYLQLMPQLVVVGHKYTVVFFPVDIIAKWDLVIVVRTLHCCLSLTLLPLSIVRINGHSTETSFV